MSTSARKARKRAGEKFVHPAKVGTPITDRIENRPRDITFPHSFKVKRHGLSSKANARLKARGIES